jgi:hypothetical protein
MRPAGGTAPRGRGVGVKSGTDDRQEQQGVHRGCFTVVHYTRVGIDSEERAGADSRLGPREERSMAQPKRTPASDAAQSATQNFEEAAKRIRDLNERVIEQGRKAGLAYLDSYESTLNRLADFEEKVGQAGQIDWITELANAQAAFIRDVTAAYTRAARDLLK